MGHKTTGVFILLGLMVCAGLADYEDKESEFKTVLKAKCAQQHKPKDLEWLCQEISISQHTTDETDMHHSNIVTSTTSVVPAMPTSGKNDYTTVGIPSTTQEEPMSSTPEGSTSTSAPVSPVTTKKPVPVSPHSPDECNTISVVIIGILMGLLVTVVVGLCMNLYFNTPGFRRCKIVNASGSHNERALP